MSEPTCTPRSPRAALAAAVAVVTLAGGLAVGGPAPVVRAASVPTLDGATAADAAASCWEIKQLHPASADGVYWLRISTLERPEQFYCDMTTDGGGWVLIGRGREGWTFRDYGQNTPQALRSNVTGPAAFSPAALSTVTIDGLLDGGAVKDLPDGLRLRRAKDRRGNVLAGSALEPARPRVVVVGDRWRPPVARVLDRRVGRHRLQQQGLQVRDARRGRREQPGWGELRRLVHLPVVRPRQGVGVLVSRQRRRPEQLQLVPLGVLVGEPRDPLHPGVHPASGVDRAARCDPRLRRAGGDAHAVPRRSPAGDRGRRLRGAQDRRLRAAPRHAGAGDHDVRRSGLCRRQVRRRA